MAGPASDSESEKVRRFDTVLRTWIGGTSVLVTSSGIQSERHLVGVTHILVAA